MCYFTVTVRAAEPPEVLRTVMPRGFGDQEKSPRYLPTPSLRNVPIKAFVEVTWTYNVALEFVLVASTGAGGGLVK